MSASSATTYKSSPIPQTKICKTPAPRNRAFRANKAKSVPLSCSRFGKRACINKIVSADHDEARKEDPVAELIIVEDDDATQVARSIGRAETLV